MDYARKIQPHLSKNQFQDIADALNGAQEAQNCNVRVPGVSLSNYKYRDVAFTLPNIEAESVTFFVDANKGSDSNSGTIDSPFKTIVKAITSAQVAKRYTVIILREGTYYLTETIQLGSQDNGLTI